MKLQTFMKEIIIVFKLFLTFYTTQIKAQFTQEWVATPLYPQRGQG